jgi:glycerol-3-phosphate cytidylyltransferase-like family protein
MKKYKITFVDEVTATSEESAFEVLREYLRAVAMCGDVSGFEFSEIKTRKKKGGK